MLMNSEWKRLFYKIIIALRRGNFKAAKDALDNGADVKKAGEGGALIYCKRKLVF